MIDAITHSLRSQGLRTTPARRAILEHLDQCSKACTADELIEGDAHHHEGESVEHEEEHGVDPHIWVSPKNAIHMVEAIRDALMDADAPNAPRYHANAADEIADLTALDQEIEESVAGFSEQRFIAFHSAFQYFARDYGLEQVGVIELTPGESPTPGTLAEIRSLVETYNLRGLFTEPQFSPTLVEQLASDLGVEVAVLDPLETGGENETYVEGMRRNLAALASILR